MSPSPVTDLATVPPLPPLSLPAGLPSRPRTRPHPLPSHPQNPNSATAPKTATAPTTSLPSRTPPPTAAFVLPVLPPVVLGAGGALVRVANPLVVDVGVAEPGSPEIVSVVDWEGPGATEEVVVEVEVVEGAVVCGR